jgi:plasmid stabilization system protein ParE
MTKIVYRDSANNDLADIRTYYSNISEQVYNRVISDISASIEILKQSPEAGFVYKTGRRRIVSQKYKFVVTYRYVSEYVEIVGIYRFQNR